jgi:NTP pyrophosphatase (non-canonical NTP hydrolase)
MELQNKIINWAEEKDLLKSENKYQQVAKVMEELGELSKAILKNDVLQQIDGIGDVQVTLIILSQQLGLDYNACLEAAWQEIKDRKGKTVGGTFIKNEQ